MPHQTVRHYALTPYEAELLACFRLLNEAKQGAVSILIASLSEPGRHALAEPVSLSLVSKS